MRWTVLSGVAAWLAAAGLLAACADGTGPANEQRVAMAPISFNEIAGWADDKHAEALVSFRRSCPKLTTGPDTKIATFSDVTLQEGVGRLEAWVEPAHAVRYVEIRKH